MRSADHLTNIPPWLFCLLALPSGVAGWSVGSLLLPYMLRKHGVAVDSIAAVLVIASLPNVWSFLTSPVNDLGFSRRTSVLLFSALIAFFGCAAIFCVDGSLAVMTVILFSSHVIATLIGSAAGALMSTVEPSIRGRAAGWYQAGNIGVSAVMGGALIWLSDRVPLPLLALAAVAIIFVPSLVVLFIPETPLPRLAPKLLFTAFFHDVWLVLSARRTWLGLVFFLSPVGAGGLTNLISSVGPDYHASGDLVALITGAGGGVLMGIGCVLGGWVCDRVHRKTCYAVFGMFVAASAAYLWLAPTTAFTYAIGYAAYSFSTGLTFAAYSALVLEVLGRRHRGAATGYALLNSSGNVALLYMTWLDGLGYRYGGVRGLMITETLAGGIGAIILLLIARHAVRCWPHLTDIHMLPAAKTATA